MKGKRIGPLYLAMLMALVQPTGAQPDAAPQGRFDLLAKALAPFIALATAEGNEGNHALDLEATLLETVGLPVELKGTRLHIAFEFPDKWRAQIPTPNGPITIGDNGDTIWAYPGGRLRPLLDHLRKKDGKKKKQASPEGLHLTAAEALLLPALLNVRDTGNVVVGESTLRVLDVGVMPEVKIKELNGCSARVWIRPENDSIAQLAIHTPSWSTTFLIEKSNFSVSLPPETWEPTAEQRADMVKVPASAVISLIEHAVKPPAPTATSSR